MPISTAKQRLRDRLRRQRRALPYADVVERSRRISRALGASAIFRDAHRVVLYSPTENEVGTEAIWQHARQQDKRVYYPRLTAGRQEIEFVLRSEGQPLVPGAFGIPVPQGDELLAGVTAADVVVTPAVAFDRAGRRLGRGRGYYDRAFRSVLAGALRVGVAYAFQIIDEVPSDIRDERVDYVVTEAGCLECTPQSLPRRSNRQ